MDRTDPRPLYVQLGAALRAQIAGRTLRPGDVVPTEDELCRRYGVARSVVRQALSGLADDGLIHRRRGRGTVVASARGYRREVGQAGGLGEQLAAAGRALRTELVDVRRGGPPSPAEVELGPARMWRFERLRRVDGTPAVLVRTWVPVALFPDLDTGRLAEVALHDLMREHGHFPVGGRRHVQAVPADEYVAGLLGVPVGAPLLLLEGVTRDAAGRGLEWFSTWHHADTVFDIDATVGDGGGVGPPADPTGGELGRLRALVDDLSAALDDLGA